MKEALQIETQTDKKVKFRKPSSDLTGQSFGKLLVVSFSYRNPKTYKRYWNCACQCGTSIEVDGSHLVAGHTKSCGCILTKHGNARRGSETPEYRAWLSAKVRTGDINHPSYRTHGGRGITMCDRWENSFENFLEDMGTKPSQKHSLDRIDNNKGYSKENCRWATIYQQARNKRSTRIICFNGVKKSLPEWSEEYGIMSERIRQRLKSGWSIEKSLTTKARKYSSIK